MDRSDYDNEDKVDTLVFWITEYEHMKEMYIAEKNKNNRLQHEIQALKVTCENLEGAMRLVNNMINK